MNSGSISSIVIVGNDIYADIVCCYLAAQLKSFGVKIHRVIVPSAINPVTIDADHSIHVFNQELGLDFNQLFSSGVLSPQLINECILDQKKVFFESYPYLKDDLPLPNYQVMMRLIQSGVAADYYFASPLVALHRIGKFHPQLHRFYKGDIRPYGAVLNCVAYSTLLQELSVKASVNFINTQDMNVNISTNGYIDLLECKNGQSIKNAFFIDMTAEQRLMRSVMQAELIDPHRNIKRPFWLANCLSFHDLLNEVSKPVNTFEWLFRALVRFVDFFPDVYRQNILAYEYNRLQLQDVKSISDFLTVFKWLGSKQKNDLPEALQHSVDLFIESCQLSQDGVDWAYVSYWPSMLVASGQVPKQVPRRVQEIPLEYLKKWYYQRQQNIDRLLRDAR